MSCEVGLYRCDLRGLLEDHVSRRHVCMYRSFSTYRAAVSSSSSSISSISSSISAGLNFGAFGAPRVRNLSIQDLRRRRRREGRAFGHRLVRTFP